MFVKRDTGKQMAAQAPGNDNQERVAERTEGVALSGLLGANPETILANWQTFAGQVAKQPELMFRLQLQYQTDLASIWLGQTDTADDRDTDDARFSDPAWREDPYFSRLRRAYFAWSRTLDKWIKEAELEGMDRQRAAFLLEIAKEVFAPVNSPYTPETIKRAIETRGESLVKGIGNFLDDQANNHGYPAVADRAAFKVGVDVAPTPGKVIYRDEMLELIQYVPTTLRVYRQPLLYVFSQVNRFYLGDLTNDRSLFQQLLAEGIQVFAISWRNPLAEHSQWSLASYTAGVIRAISVVRSICGVKRVDLMGLCAGGLTAAAAAGVLQAQGKKWIKSLSLFVSILDNQPGDSDFTLFVTDESVASQKSRVRAQGMMKERDILEMFAMLRLDESIFSFVRSNYYRGEAPLAHPLLFWSMDYTRVPAEMQCDFIDLAHRNAMALGELDMLDQRINLKDIEYPVYIMAGTTDHITPWRGCYRSAHLFGGPVEFVLTNQNHTQTISAKADNPHLRYWLREDAPVEADEWLQGAYEHSGDWRHHWIKWLQSRSRLVDAPRKQGNKRFPAIDNAPGRYVLER
jgi:polyhydroxyalkanoate synthase subunit PhaC